jgi:hypothetical protein
MISGCIISSSPSGDTVELKINQEQIFKIVTSSKTDTFAWYVDNVIQAGQNSSTFSYLPDAADAGEHVIKTIVSGMEERKWNVKVIAEVITWKKSFERIGSIITMHSVQHTADGGYIAAGEILDVLGNDTNCFIVKLDTNGGIDWEKTIGGEDEDKIFSIRQTTDGGYIAAGSSGSLYIPGLINNGWKDFYVLKLDINGEIEWQKLFGGESDDAAKSIRQTPDGGYIVTGSSHSDLIPGVINTGYEDVYTIKMDFKGDVEWQKQYGGGMTDEANDIQAISGEGYIIVGYSYSDNIPGTSKSGDKDCYVIRLDAAGSVIWQRLIGGNGSDGLNSAVQMSDGTFTAVGYSKSTNMLGLINTGESDCLVLNLEDHGLINWQKMFGGTGADSANSVLLNSAGDPVVAAGLFDEGKILKWVEFECDNCFPHSGSGGSCTCWWPIHSAYVGNKMQTSLIKLDSGGNIIWSRTYGEINNDIPQAADATSDGGYVVAEYMRTGDLDSTVAGSSILKLDSNGNK